MPVPARFLNNGSLGPPDGAVVLYGWGYTPSAGSSATISFGMTFATPPIVIATTRGYKNTSNPTNKDDAAGMAGEIIRGGQEVTTTNAKVFVQTASGGAVPAGTRILFNIIVIGTPAS